MGVAPPIQGNGVLVMWQSVLNTPVSLETEAGSPKDVTPGIMPGLCLIGHWEIFKLTLYMNHGVTCIDSTNLNLILALHVPCWIT